MQKVFKRMICFLGYLLYILALWLALWIPFSFEVCRKVSLAV